MKLAPLKDLHMVKEIRLLTVRRDEIPPRKLLLYPPYSLFPVLLRQPGRRHYLLLLTLPVLAPALCIPEAILTAFILSPHRRDAGAVLDLVNLLRGDFLLAPRRGDDCVFLGPLGDGMSYLLLFLGFNFFFFPYPTPLGM